MPKIRINASEAGVRKNLSSAYEEFLRHCRLRNLSPHTLEYYRENLYYIQRILKLNYADELTKDKVDELIDHELDKGNKVGAINTRIPLQIQITGMCSMKQHCARDSIWNKTSAKTSPWMNWYMCATPANHT